MIYKSIPALVIFALVVYILYLTQCNPTKPCIPVTVTKTVKVDTQRIIDDYTSGWEKPKPDTVIRPKYISVKAPDPIFVEHTTIISQKVDTQAIMEDYLSTRVYRDSTSLKHGKVYVTDSITRNQIMARQWIVQDTSIDVTRTTVSSPTRKIYIGGGFYTNPAELVSGAHVDIGYINRKDQQIEYSLLRMSGRNHHGITFHQVIHLRKH